MSESTALFRKMQAAMDLSRESAAGKKRTAMQRIACCMCVAVVGGSFSSPFFPTRTAASEVNDQLTRLQAVVKQLQLENQALRDRLSIVERRLDATVAAKDIRSTDPVVSQPAKTAWRKLRRGMNADEVSALLGDPERVVVIDPLTFWEYPRLKDAPRTPSVTFNADLTVRGWQEP